MGQAGGRHETSTARFRVRLCLHMFSPFGIFKYRHWLALLLDHIVNRGFDVLRIPQPARATVTAPAFFLVSECFVQRPAGTTLELAQDLFGTSRRTNHSVNVGTAHMRRQQAPFLAQASVLYGFQRDGTAVAAKPLR